MSETTIYDRAVAGARFLDQHVRGWRRRVRRRELDMRRGRYVPGDCGCVLAQLDACGSYDLLATELLGEPYGDAAHELGFMAVDDYDADEWAALTEAWRTVIRENVR